MKIQTVKTRYKIGPGLLRLAEVCQLVGMSESTAKRRIAAGDLVPAKAALRKPLLFTVAEATRFAGRQLPEVLYQCGEDTRDGLLTVAGAMRKAGRGAE